MGELARHWAQVEKTLNTNNAQAFGKDVPNWLALVEQTSRWAQHPANSTTGATTACTMRDQTGADKIVEATREAFYLQDSTRSSFWSTWFSVADQIEPVRTFNAEPHLSTAGFRLLDNQMIELTRHVITDRLTVIDLDRLPPLLNQKWASFGVKSRRSGDTCRRDG